MKTKTLAIGLVADRIDMLLCQGDRVVAARRIPVMFDPDPERWGKIVKDSANAVRSAVKELGAEGAQAIVLYRSPTECAEYVSLRVRSNSEAQQAAILSCADSLSCPLDLAVCQASIIGRDASSTQPQTHVVVAADRDEAISSISGIIEQANLRFDSATPLDAILMTRLAKRALNGPREHAGYLYVGEHRSFFVISGAGSLLFARPINLGIDGLISCLTRPIRAANGGEPIELSRETAREILHKHGFPKRSQVVHEPLGLIGGQIIPLLAPILQRYIIELRQSLRFALPEELRQSVKLSISGPGSAIPGLASIMTEELRVPVSADELYKAYDYQRADSEGSELLDAIASRKLLGQLGLQPQHIARSRQATRMRRWLWTGAAAAMVLIAADAVRCYALVNDARLKATAAASRSANSKTLQSTGEKLFAAVGAMNKLETVISHESGARVNLRACMQELSRLTPESIRLTNITFRQVEGHTVGNVSGYALAGPSNGKAEIEPFIGRLQGSPLFEKVVLANVQMQNSGEVAGQRFEANFTAVAAPRGPHAQSIAIASGAAKP